MVAGTFQLGRKQFVVLPAAEYNRLRQRAGIAPQPIAGDIELPHLPHKLPSGNYPALMALRVGLAQKLIQRRWAVRLSQAQLARTAGIRPETLNRIEKAKVTADAATVIKIVHALENAEKLEYLASAVAPRRR